MFIRQFGQWLVSGLPSLFVPVLMLFVPINGHAQDLGSACGQAAPGAPSVLVGRFFKTGPTTTTGISDNSEGVLQVAVGSSLRRLIGANATIWTNLRGGSDKAMGGLIENAFVRGAFSASSTDGNSSALAEYLRELHCDFLVGGDVNLGDNFVIVTPYLFDVRRRTIEVPFKPISVSSGNGLETLGTYFGERLGKALVERRLPDNPSSIALMVGCFSVDLARGGKLAKKFADDLTREISAELSGDPNYGAGVRPIGPDCPSDLLAGLPGFTKAVLFSGIISGTESGNLTLQPRFQLLTRNSAATQSIFLDQEIGSFAKRDVLVHHYLRDTNTFFVAVNLPNFSDRLVDQSQALQNIKDKKEVAIAFDGLVGTLLSARDPEALAVANVFAFGYSALSQAQDSPDVAGLSRYAFGAALQAKAQYRLAVDQFTRSFTLHRDLGQTGNAQRDEALGSAYSKLGVYDDAIVTLNSAWSDYSRGNDQVSASRIKKKLAQTRFAMKDFRGAKQELLKIPNLLTDSEGLILLGDVSFNLRDHSAAVKWYNDAADLAPTSSNDLRGKIARSYQAMAAPDANGCYDPNAEANLRLALKQLENPADRFRVSWLAFKSGDYEQSIVDLHVITDARQYTSFQWAEAAWLNIIEADILTGRFNVADSDGQLAITTAFAKVSDSRLLAAYLRTLARALQDPDGDKVSLLLEDVYQDTLLQIVDRRNKSISKTNDLNWDNTALQDYYTNKVKLNASRLAAIQDLESQIGITQAAKTNPQKKGQPTGQICP